MPDKLYSLLSVLRVMSPDEILARLKLEGIQSKASRRSLAQRGGGVICGCPLAVFFTKVVGLPCKVHSSSVECQGVTHMFPDSVYKVRVHLDVNPDSEFWSPND